MSRSPPTLRAILGVDMLARFAAVAPVSALLVAALAAVAMPRVPPSHELAHLPLWVAAAAWALVAPASLVVAWRVAKIRRAFAGVVVPGVVTQITAFPHRNRAYVSYRFEVGGRSIESRHFVHRSAAMRALRTGQDVEVAVDPSDPATAFVVALFG